MIKTITIHKNVAPLINAIIVYDDPLELEALYEGRRSGLGIQIYPEEKDEGSPFYVIADVTPEDRPNQ